MITAPEQSPQFLALKQQLLQVGLAIPGTIHALYARCGSNTCPCATDKTKRHGPYYRWYRRARGRLIAQGILPEDLPIFEQWMENREKIEQIVEQILKIGADYAETLAKPSETPKDKSKKTSSPKRGK